jgi:Ca2+-binding RTX toxin-like protein
VRRVLTLVLTVSALSLAPGVAHAAGTCQGLPATIESAGGTVTGTEGPDVILVTGPADVDALGGEDTICVSGGTLDAGSGNDQVSVSGTGGQHADLGAGDDTYVSVGQTDYVDLNAFDSEGTDHIDTGDGRNDEVGTGARGESNHDVINTSQGALVHLQAGAGSGVQLLGGGAISFVATDKAAYVFNGRHGTLTRNRVSVATYAITTLSYEVRGQRAAVTVKGSNRADSVTVDEVADFQADLGAGSDHLRLSQSGPRSGRVEGGSGENYLTVIATTRITGDLARRTLTQVSGDRRTQWFLAGFDSMDLSARTIDVEGRGVPDNITAYGCDVALDGRGGRDVFTVGTVLRGLPTPKCQHRGVLEGGPGDDTLYGGDGPDVLLGGAGNDLASGGRGSDRCVAEHENSCER